MNANFFNHPCWALEPAEQMEMYKRAILKKNPYAFTQFNYARPEDYGVLRRGTSGNYFVLNPKVHVANPRSPGNEFDFPYKWITPNTAPRFISDRWMFDLNVQEPDAAKDLVADIVLQRPGHEKLRDNIVFEPTGNDLLSDIALGTYNFRDLGSGRDLEKYRIIRDLARIEQEKLFKQARIEEEAEALPEWASSPVPRRSPQRPVREPFVKKNLFNFKKELASGDSAADSDNWRSRCRPAQAEIFLRPGGNAGDSRGRGWGARRGTSMPRGNQWRNRSRAPEGSWRK